MPYSAADDDYDDDDDDDDDDNNEAMVNQKIKLIIERIKSVTFYP